MTDKLSGQAGVVTGGTGGLGTAVVAALLEEGAHVVVPYRDADKADSLRKQLGDPAPDRLELVEADLTDDATAARVINTAIKRHGRLDYLLNLAGAWAGGKPLEKSDATEFDRMIDQNLRTSFSCTRHALAVMKESGSGAIVNVAAGAALDPAPQMVPYSISKAGVVALTRGAHAEAHSKGVRTNAVLPGTIDTPANREAMPDADHSQWVAPDDIAGVLVFLLSPEAGTVSGAAIPV